MSRLIVFCCCILSAISAVSQVDAEIKKGDAYMKSGRYEKAVACYKKAVASDKMAIMPNEKLGKALMAAGEFQNAEPVYSLLASMTPGSSIDHFYYGQALVRNSKYGEAAKAYQAYFTAHPDDPLAGEFKDFESRVKLLQYDSNKFKLINVPDNTSGSDEGPSVCIFFVCYSTNGHSKDTVEKTYDLYMLKGGNPTNPPAPEKLKGDIDGMLNEGPATFSRNGREMIFTRSNYGHKGTDGEMRLGLYHAEYDLTSKKWGKITPLNFIDYNHNFKQPSLSRDGSALYFSSDIDGGTGETDIYVSHLQGNTWSAPVNLGSGINTVGREETPYITDDGILYFASDCHMGLGGLDIFSARFMDGKWGHVINPGAPLNSSYNDFGYILDTSGESGYLVSDRPGGMGGNDIYQFIPLGPKH